jgi:hypothetical protein
VPDVSATDLARGVRQPSHRALGPGSPPPPAFLVKPTTVARAAVREFHRSGAAAARGYLAQALARELAHTHASTRANAVNTVAGLDHYIAADTSDGRSFVMFGGSVPIALPSGTVTTKIDVIVQGSAGLAARAIFWDGLGIGPQEAEVIAFPYAVALQTLCPGQSLDCVCVWQARRNAMHEVAVSTALSRAGAADAVLAGL